MDSAAVSEAIKEAIGRAVCTIPEHVENSLIRARRAEKSRIAQRQLDCILENVKRAGGKRPVCQDTGLPLFFIRAKQFSNEIEAAVYEGLSKATREIPLRKNCVDPLSRKPLGNVPIIKWEFSDDNSIEIEFLPKGAGSENASALAMLKPSEGVRGIERFVLQTVLKNAKNACPPIILGVGIGGSADIAMALAKKALLRDRNGEEWALEESLLEKINSLGIGVMGLGGSTTCLAVKVEKSVCHTASLPVAVNMQCWAHRHAKIRVYGDGAIGHS